MPRNGSGTYTLPTGNPVVSATPIRSTWANSTLTDIATAITGSLARDGQSVPTANLPMAGFRHTSVGVAVALTDYARASQVQSGSLLRCTAEAMPTADVYTASLPFGETAFNNGQVIVLAFPTANVGTTPTLNVNASAAWPILREDGSSIQVGDCRTGVPSQLLWNSTAWLLLGTASGSGAGVSSFNLRSGAVTMLSADVVTALGFQPVNRAGDTFTGPIILAGDAATSLQPVSLQQMLATIAAIPTIAGVTTFNTRSGDVALLSADVTGALGFSPVPSFNARTGAITLLSADVTAALGYTPASSASGVASFNTRTGTVALTSLDVTTALGFAPVASFNTRTGVVALTSLDVTGALGYTPLNAAGGTITYEREARVVIGNVSGSQALNWLGGGLVTATITGSGAIFTHANLPNGVVGYLTVSLTNGGVATSIATLFPSVKWPGGSTFYSLTASGRDEVTLRCHDGSTIDVVGFAKGMA